MTPATSPQTMDILDVAIVGGGVGGAYAAYRLLKAKPGDSVMLDTLRAGKSVLNVALFEESSRIGGRLWTHHEPLLPDLPIELGGQGFSELQQNVYGLCKKELRSELTVVNCQAFSMGPQLQYQRRHRFPYQAYSPLPPDPGALSALTPADRESRLRNYHSFIVKLCPSVPPLPEPLGSQPASKIAAWCTAAKSAVEATPGYYPGVVPYFLEDKEKWTDPFQLQLSVMLGLSKPLADSFASASAEIQKTGASATFFSEMNALQTLLRTVTLPDGHPLSAHGFWNFFRDRLSSEAYSMGGFASFASSSIGNWNLYDSCLASIWGTLFYMVPTPYYSVQEGYDSLPAALIAHFESAGGVVKTEDRVQEVRMDTSHGEPLVALTAVPATSKGQARVIYARHVIFALPRKALEMIQWIGPLCANQAFDNDIKSVQAVRASKIFLAYAEPWWERTTAMSLKGGYSTTDLPLRACYYMGTQADRRSLMLASLSDEESETFWAAYEKTPGPQAAGPSGYLTREMLDQLQSQLAEVHGISPPAPIAGPIAFNWAGDPYGGGWHDWRPGLKSWEVMPRIRAMSVPNPGPESPIYVCGEAYSNQQGWVEGALNTAEMVLETYFKLPRPRWVASTYDFGP